MDPVILKKARLSLARRDSILKPIIRSVGPCTLKTNGDAFEVLVRSIISQQISTKAAIAISGRVLDKVGKFEPKRILTAHDDDLRAAGLSRGKLLSLRDLAAKCTDGTVPLKKLNAMPDDEVAATLTQVRGIGPWTAEMFLIFCLGRPDVLPVGDYGLRAGVQRHYALADLPNKIALTDLAECWKPYRSIGTWYIWRSLGGVPQSE